MQTRIALQRFLPLGLAGLIWVASSALAPALAQDPLELGLTNASGLPGETVDISVSFNGNGETSGFGGDFVIADPDAFSSVDLSSCLDGNTSAVGTCVHPGGDQSRVRILLANDAVTPLADFTGTISFTIDGAAAPAVVGLNWDDTSWDTSDPVADVNGTDGSVEVLGVQVDPLELGLTDESGNPGDTVDVSVSFTGNGETSGFGGDFVIADPDAFSNVDLSSCLAGNTSAVGTCVHPGGDQSRVRILLANDAVTPLADFTGTISFTIDSAAAPAVVGLNWDDTSWDTSDPVADVNGTDGSVEVLEVLPPQIQVDPAAFDLSLEEGQTSVETLTISNQGDEDLDWSIAGIPEGGCVLPAWIVPDPTGGTVAGGTSQDISLNIDTDGLAPGDHTGQVCIDSNDPQTPQAVVSVALEVTPGGPQPDIGIAPASHDFGTLEPGDSDMTTFTVTNTGDGDGLDITSTAITGDAEFSLGTDTCDGATLDAGATCTIEVVFAPAADGTFSASLDVDSNAGSVSADVSGAAASQPGFGSNPPAPGINLGNTEPGGQLFQDVVITNTGTEDLSVDCGPLDDPDGVFSIVPDPVVFAGIPPGESETFTVSCQIPEAGNFSATMSCTTNDPGNATVDYQFSCQSAALVIPTLNWGGLLLLSLLIFITTWVALRYVRPV